LTKDALRCLQKLLECFEVTTLAEMLDSTCVCKKLISIKNEMDFLKNGFFEKWIFLGGGGGIAAVM
jgi:hypothetical protein